MQNNEEETPDNNVTDEIEEQQHGGRHDIEIIAGAQAGPLVEEVDHAHDEDDFDDHGAGDNDARAAANHVTDDARAAANHVTYKSASANHDSAHFQPLNSINQFLSSYSNEEEEDGEDNIIDEDHDGQNHDNDDDEDEAAVEGNQTISFEFKYYAKGTVHK